MNARRHGWQHPLHPFQMLGMTIYVFLVASFYCFLGIFLGNKAAEIIVCSVFGFVAVLVMFLFIRCVALDPTDKTRLRRKNRGRSKGLSQLNYGFVLRQLVARMVRRIEHKVHKTWIRRKYFGPRTTNCIQNEPLLPFPFVTHEDVVAPDPKEDDISFCSLCDFEVKQHSKHCRTCNRCVEGFDHHCKWLNNCVGKKNYTTFILLMVFVLLLLSIEGGTAIAIFVRCFVDKKGVDKELLQRHYVKFPKGALAAIAVFFVLIIAYGLAALGQLFFFHVVLIQKGLRTYEYILAMRDASHQGPYDQLDDSDWSSSEDDDSFENFQSPPASLTIKIDPKAESSKKQSLSPWRLLKMSKTRALEVADKAKEMLVKQKTPIENVSLYPLPFEMKNGPLMTSLGKLPGSPRFSSPRRRISGPPNMLVHNGSFDFKLAEVSRELETHISRQVLCSALKKAKDDEASSPI